MNVRLNRKTIELSAKVLYWVLFFFVVYLIFELIRKLLGGSLSFESLTIALIVMHIGLTITLTFVLLSNQHKAELRLRSDINKIDLKISKHLVWHEARNK